MCGRYAITPPPQAARDYFGYVEQPNFPPRYNIAPTQPVPLVGGSRRGRRRADFMLVRWGFLPGFVKDPSRISAADQRPRRKRLPEKPSFRAAMRRRRCLVHRRRLL